jgi:hypothetical protein
MFVILAKLYHTAGKMILFEIYKEFK